MKRTTLALLIVIFILTACGQVTPQPIIVSETPSPASTPLPSSTPIITVTPLPTIPTFTPTFDVSTIVTVTPAPKAICPIIQENLPVELESFDDYYPELITAVNQGTSIQTVIAIFEKKIDEFYFPNTEILVHSKIRYELVDVTNDGVPEILLPGSISDQPNAIILGCRDGEYRILYSSNYDTAKRIYFMPVDANRNGINEVILAKESGTATGSWIELSVIEWHIESFHELLTDDYSSSVFQLVMIDDLDNDDTKEIFWRFGAYIYSPPPWRRGTITYKWNGEKFVALPLEYDPVQYRFQAIQDGDHATINGNFTNAEILYQEAIFNQDLEWWSSQRQLDTMRKVTDEGFAALGTPAPGNPDTTEYPRLAAYAYYRIMLINLMQNNESNALTTYNTLQQEFGNDPYARPYAEMASKFWEAYQSTHKMYGGCAAAIQYAVEHPEILTPLGSDYHGSQAKIGVGA